jgi:hypothetical protein
VNRISHKNTIFIHKIQFQHSILNIKHQESQMKNLLLFQTAILNQPNKESQEKIEVLAEKVLKKIMLKQITKRLYKS